MILQECEECIQGESLRGYDIHSFIVGTMNEEKIENPYHCTYKQILERTKDKHTPEAY